MRLTSVLVLLSLIGTTSPVAAQDWMEFFSREDGFRVDFPGQPEVQNTTYMSEYEYSLPARVYTAVSGQQRYVMTVVDYNGIEKLGQERSKGCPPGAEPCKGSMNTGEGYWKMELGGAIVYATWRLLQRDAKLTHLTWSWVDLVEGQSLQLTNNTDKSRTFAFISMHRNKVYILEATVPAGYPAPGLFQQSMGYLDPDGKAVRYQYVYSNRFPPPPRTGQGAAVSPVETGSLGGGR